MLRGEIYSINLGKGRDREFSGVQFVVVVTDNFTNSLSMTVRVVPGVDARERQGGILVNATESGLPHDLRLLPSHIRSIDFGRFAKKKALGTVPTSQMDSLGERLKSLLEIK